MLASTIYGKNDLRTERVPVPTPRPGQVRIAVEYVGICGSDIHYYFEGANGSVLLSEPLVPGHEVAGKVDLDLEGGFAEGTPVVIHPARFGQAAPGLEGREQLWPGGSYLGSASTFPHTQGAMRQYIVVDRPQIRSLPEQLPLKRAVLAEPLAVALHALHRVGHIAGSQLLVVGAGPIGLLAAGAAVRAHARVSVTDLLAPALKRARSLGVDDTIDATDDSPRSGGYDIVLECTGTQGGLQTALRAVRVGGTIVQVGNLPDRALEVNLSTLSSKELAYLGSQRFIHEIDEAIELLAQDAAFEAVITHTLAADDAEGAFELARDSARSGKVLVAMQQRRTKGRS